MYPLSIGSRGVAAADDRAGTFLLGLPEGHVADDFVVVDFGEHELPEAAMGRLLVVVIEI